MRMVALDRETNLRELADRLFVDLDANGRAKAEAELLKTNAHLGSRDSFRAGTLVQIPTIPGLKLRTEASARNDDPRAAVFDTLAETVATHRQRLGKVAETRSADVEEQLKLLNTREIAAAIRKEPGGTELAKQLTENLERTRKELAEERKRQETVFEQVARDLEALRAKAGLGGET